MPVETMRVFDQRGFEVRFGWGLNGLRQLAPGAEAIVIVDVLSFSTTVDLALGRGVVVLPYRWHDGTEQSYAASVQATVASNRGDGGYTLSPASLADAPAGLRLVLPSPNGSALTFGAAEAGATRTLVGCLRNADAIARSLEDVDSVAVIAAGEHWNGTTGSMRPAIEDLLGAGRIIEALGRSRVSPEARVAAAAASLDDGELRWALGESGSGRELRARGFASDVELAGEINASAVVPALHGAQLVNDAL